MFICPRKEEKIKHCKCLFRMKKLLISSLLLLFSSYIFAQKGILKGTVNDAKTGESLVGTTILIQGTTIGTITDFDGNFILPNITPGAYNMVISFISYQSQIIRVEIKDGQETVLNVQLEPATLDVGEVQVVAKKRNDTEMSLISGLKAQNLIVSGISAQQISKSQDKDAAEVIRRVPGITITDGRFVIVRGLVERYNSVMLNNSTAPSFEADKRAFSFDAIPSGLIDNILIYKSPAPELPADFAGAAINIQTKNAADQNSFNLSYGTKYVQNTTFNNDFQTFEKSKTDWLGFDNGSRAIPEGVPSPQEFNELYVWPNAELYIQRTEEINKISALFANNWETSHDAPFLDQNFSFSLQRRFVAGKVSIGNLTSLNYGTSNNYTEGTRTEFLEFDEDQYRTVMDFNFVDQVSKKEYKTGLIHNWNLIYGKNQKLEFRNFLNQSGIQTTTQRNGIRYDNGETLELFDLKYESRFVYSGQLSGEQLFKNGRTKINWMAGYSHTNKEQPDNRRLYWVQINDETSERYQDYYLRVQNVPNPYYSGRLWIDMKENTVDGKLDFSHNFKLFDSENDWFFKTGGFYENKKRQFNSRLIGVVAVRNPPDIFVNPVSEIFAPENFYFDRTTPYTEHGLSYRDNTRAKDSYNANDEMKAGYASLSIPVTKKLNVYGGIRAENWRREITDFWELTESADKTPIVRDTVDIFPSVNITYNINEKNLLRLSYGETVNRPEFREMAPFDYQDFELFAIVYGNPDLKAAYVNNYDLRYEWYPRQGEMISVAGFYKTFTDPIESFLRPSGSTYDYFFYNTEEAYSAGVEIDVRKRFDELENSTSFIRFMKDLTVIFNTSLIKSEINTSQQEFTRDTVRVMSGQSPYIVNLGLFYNNNEKGWDINLNYNIIGKRIAYVGTPANPHTWELPRNSLDLTVQKTFKHNLQLKAGIKDILNDPVRFVQYYGDNEEIISDTRKYIPNRQFSVALTWTL
jgi:outer membrane receptor protein involved in Fe transport